MPARTLKWTLVLWLTVPGVAAAAPNGGTAAPGTPAITALKCLPAPDGPCPSGGTFAPGSRLRVTRRALDNTRALIFRGESGQRDDARVRARHVGAHHVDARVPRRARSGPLAIIARTGGSTGPARPVQIEAPTQAVPAEEDAVLSIRGRHDLGQSATNNFGGGRNHQGQDMFADCGTPLVAARGGTVRRAGTEGSMGNFAVITDAFTGGDNVYMHMRSEPLVATGQTVRAGDPIGDVGDTGNASGCHLHFERWTAPGWYAGGQAVDPLPQLRAWSARS